MCVYVSARICVYMYVCTWYTTIERGVDCILVYVLNWMQRDMIPIVTLDGMKCIVSITCCKTLLIEFVCRYVYRVLTIDIYEKITIETSHLVTNWHVTWEQ